MPAILPTEVALGPPAAARTAAEPSAAPAALDAEETMAVLSSVLDDLGAAHHRPFSRE